MRKNPWNRSSPVHASALTPRNVHPARATTCLLPSWRGGGSSSSSSRRARAPAAQMAAADQGMVGWRAVRVQWHQHEGAAGSHLQAGQAGGRLSALGRAPVPSPHASIWPRASAVVLPSATIESHGDALMRSSTPLSVPRRDTTAIDRITNPAPKYQGEDKSIDRPGRPRKEKKTKKGRGNAQKLCRLVARSESVGSSAPHVCPLKVSIAPARVPTASLGRDTQLHATQALRAKSIEGKCCSKPRALWWAGGLRAKVCTLHRI
jgi:hypothetical protein